MNISLPSVSLHLHAVSVSSKSPSLMPPPSALEIFPISQRSPKWEELCRASKSLHHSPSSVILIIPPFVLVVFLPLFLLSSSKLCALFFIFFFVYIYFYCYCFAIFFEFFVYMCVSSWSTSFYVGFAHSLFWLWLQKSLGDVLRSPGRLHDSDMMKSFTSVCSHSPFPVCW